MSHTVLARHLVKTSHFLVFLFLASLTLVTTPATAQDMPPHAAPTTHVQIVPLPPVGSENFDPVRITDAYLAKVSGAARAKSDAYFEGGYILSVVDMIYALAVAAGFLLTGFAARLRDGCRNRISRRWLQTPAFVAAYLGISTAVTLPLTIYEGFFREHAYGLSNQSFGGWVGDFAIQFALSLIGLSLLISLIYAVAKKAKKLWWLWGTGLSIAFFAFLLVIQPVFIEPLLNHYSPLPDSGMKSAIISLAHANGVPAKNVYVYDASRQTNRISANVAGFLGTTRIALNDNLLDQCSPSEVLAVLGHEIGHYVMNHVGLMLLEFAFLLAALFALVAHSFRALMKRFGVKWGISGETDPAGLPLMVALFSFFMFWATPVFNTITRTAEQQADVFGLNAARQPDAFAEVALKLSTYRKLDPTAFEELWFYDHPSGRTRILTAMRWKKAHMADPDIASGPISPGQGAGPNSGWK